MKYFYPSFIYLLILCIVTTVACHRESQVIPTGDSASVSNGEGTLEERIKATKDGDVITLKSGKYNLDKRLVIDREITIRGETSEKVILTSSDSCVFEISFGSPIFENLTVISDSEDERSAALLITGGSPKLQSCAISSYHGTGIHVSQKETAPEVRDCTIKECGGSGILVENYACGTFVNCDIYGNQSDEIVVKNNANPTFLNCRIHEGKTVGIAVSQKGRGIFLDCDIYGHTPMEIMISSYSTPVFQKCKIHDGTFGVGVIQMSLGTFEECDIFGHLLAGVATNLGGAPIFSKCKIRDGKGMGIFIREPGLGSFSYCDIFGNENGVYISNSGSLFLGKCQIHDQRKCGILAEKQANAHIDSCDIYKNTEAGIHITDSSKLHVSAC
ncbi:MAG: right-handed parallel beta-helix repeat-containing protein [Planctomycetia bacterium]|nr:right-handed parallel beta-helix repeat-containing protein [Planctomycetia bacterium]